jgi:ATP-dependent helicase HrpA
MSLPTRAPAGRDPDGAEAPLEELRARLSDLTLRDEHRLRRRFDRLRSTHGDEARGDALERIAREIEQGEGRVAKRRAAMPRRIDYPAQLPVSARKDDLLAAIRDHQVVVVAGETGSGKTTQLPKVCLELGRGIRGAIAHTQPRRLAARTVAERIADELDVRLGEAVGYAVRFNDRSRDDTLVRLVTDGLLLAEIQHDPLLRRYDTIIVDEAHERSLNIDFLLGCIKRILPKRPELKLIITSATIDPERFSRHFGDAPIVEVSGRTYPVEVRYRPLTRLVADEDGDRAVQLDRDQAEAIGDAIEELGRESAGDVLVFLSGEREIRDTADALRGRLDPGTEVLPLYARLSTAEQNRVFRPHRARRRVVLATNVAETSLTVPGIRYVVDPGTARISRYSARLKVQRLPIEEISQASADQRKGRCGRTSDGICIRLYDEEDFAARPRYTDPEVLRTNLASVILQMAALGLGDIEAFPFLDPPDRRQIRDGVLLLEELGALRDGQLTPLGRRLAQLPVDPRLARMVLEADRLGCAREVIVIAAALSIQDPRERPSEQQAQADQSHARFRDEHSDFVAFVNLWRYLREQQRELSGSQFRKRLRAEFLHYLRVREWQDLAGQLRQSAKELGITLNQEPAEPQQIHVALLAGLLSHVGVKDATRRGEYLGARGARFTIFPGSALARRAPDWTMVAELVETSRLFGRTAARIDPAWVEPLAEDLVRRQYSEPRWEKRRASVVATERVTLYGLPIVAGRTVAYGAIDPVLSRELFIRRALVEGDWHTRHHFFHENRARVEEVEALEDRARRRDILADDETLFAFYDARIPADVVSGAHFDRWWRGARHADPRLLDFTPELLINADAAGALDERARPETWTQDGLELRLSYRFEPGTDHDGVTVHVPLDALGALRADGFEWLVPAFREELITTLIRTLPKELRRQLAPAPDVARHVLARLPAAGSEPLLPAVARGIQAVRGVRIPDDALSLERLPGWLRVTFRIEDGNGGELASGKDLGALRAEVRPRLQAALTATAGPRLERSGLRAWEIGTLPRSVELPGTGGAVRAYPALVDEGATVGVRVLDTPDEQWQAMWAGTRRLLLTTSPSPARWVGKRLSGTAQLSLATAPHGSLAAVLDDATVTAVEALMTAAGAPAWDAEGFATLRDYVAGELAETTEKIVAWVVRILDAMREAQRRMDALPADPQLHAARLDVARQLGRLVFPGFVRATGVARLPDVERYLRGAAQRLERLPTQIAADRDRMTAVHELEAAYADRVAAWRGRPQPPALREVGWLLEELRISHFAQGLGTKGSVSGKRIRRALGDVGIPA